VEAVVDDLQFLQVHEIKDNKINLIKQFIRIIFSNKSYYIGGLVPQKLSGIMFSRG
jgi:hypothetical protein